MACIAVKSGSFLKVQCVFTGQGELLATADWISAAGLVVGNKWWEYLKDRIKSFTTDIKGKSGLS